MSGNNADELAVEAAATLGRQSALTQLDSHIDDLILVSRHDEMNLEELDLEGYLPEPARSRGHAVLHDPHSFVEYVNRLAVRPLTTAWADLSTRSISAVLNDHGDNDQAGWRDHTVALELQVDPEWTAWTNASGKLKPQTEFAEFLEEHTPSIKEPSAADLLEVATTFQANRGVTFSQGTRLSSGEVQLRYEETTTSTAGRRGQLEVPERIKLELSPFLGGDPVEITALLRWRIDPNTHKLAIGFTLQRHDLALRQAFDRIRQTVVEGLTDVPTFVGKRPDRITPR